MPLDPVDALTLRDDDVPDDEDEDNDTPPILHKVIIGFLYDPLKEYGADDEEPTLSIVSAEIIKDILRGDTDWPDAEITITILNPDTDKVLYTTTWEPGETVAV